MKILIIIALFALATAAISNAGYEATNKETDWYGVFLCIIGGIISFGTAILIIQTGVP